MGGGEADELGDEIARNGLVLDDPFVVEPVLRDPNDDYLVALARSTDPDAGAPRHARLSGARPTSPARCPHRAAARGSPASHAVHGRARRCGRPPGTRRT